MKPLYDRYKQGAHKEIYDELMALGDKIDDSSVYEDACEVAREMMKRVRCNLEELVIPRLKQMGYRFGDGSWDHESGLSDEELSMLQQEEPIFQAATEEDGEAITLLEQLVGSLPLTLTYFYREVGAINLIGCFQSSQSESPGSDQGGYGLDPLFIQPLSSVIDEARFFPSQDEESGMSVVPISPDGDLKYGYSGGGDYEIKVPCRSFDTLLEGEEHHLTFVNYLRLCFQWGGFPGLEKYPMLTQEELHFLTSGLLPF